MRSLLFLLMVSAIHELGLGCATVSAYSSSSDDTFFSALDGDEKDDVCFETGTQGSSEAHQERLPVICTGDLVKEGNTSVLKNPCHQSVRRG